MPLSSEQRSDPNLVGTLGSLALSVVRPATPTQALRSLRWQQGLSRLGLQVPFFLLHDMGMLFAHDRSTLAIGPRAELAASAFQRHPHAFAKYQSLITELSACEAARRSASLRLSDDMIVVVVSKLLGRFRKQFNRAPPYESNIASDAALFDRLEDSLAEWFGAMNRDYELDALAALQSSSLYLLIMADALDLDTLRLLGVLGNSATGSMGQVDLLAALNAPAANDIVNFSLEILPSVLESKAPKSITTRAGDGYGGLTNKGGLDNLLLSELAWDSDDFLRRFVEHEVLYYAKEAEKEPLGRRHLLLVDASASMRGDRQVFARAMALATAKKLLIQNDEVAIRFFDSRPYDAFHARAGNLPTAQVLSFAGERGRNPRRVFTELAATLEIHAARDKRSTTIHVFTHASLHIPRELITSIQKSATLAVLFIMPSGGRLNLNYLDLLNAYWVVDHQTLSERQARTQRAVDILGQISNGSLSPRSLP